MMFALRLALCFCALCLTLALGRAPAFAQIATVYGTNADAVSCYRSALMEKSNSRTIRACTSALDSGELSRKDQIAVLINRGILHKLDDNVKDAWFDYKAALARDPDQPQALANRGNLYFLAGLFDKAMDDYDRALFIGMSNEGPVRLNRAMALGWMGQDREAITQFEDVIARYPDWALARENYARYQARAAAPS